MILPLEREYHAREGFPVIEKIDTLIFSVMYPKKGCNESCKDACCSGGATMDIAAFRRLLGHRSAPRFKGITWDGFIFAPDHYSPGGEGCYTRFDNRHCMFRNEGWGCSIHSYCLEKRIDVRELKFFTCCLFPVEVNRIGKIHNVLTAGYEMRYPQYGLPCKLNGDASVYEIAKSDLAFYFGSRLIDELERLKKELRFFFCDI